MNFFEHIEQVVSKKIDQQIIDFDKTNVESLKESILFASSKTDSFDVFLIDMLQRAERLECWNVCIVVRDLIKELDK